MPPTKMSITAPRRIASIEARKLGGPAGNPGREAGETGPLNIQNRRLNISFRGSLETPHRWAPDSLAERNPAHRGRSLAPSVVPGRILGPSDNHSRIRSLRA